jgi:hypothetical protein
MLAVFMFVLLSLNPGLGLLLNHKVGKCFGYSRTTTLLEAKKDKSYKNVKQQGGPSKQETQSRVDKFDALTRKFMFTIQGLTKALPDGSRTILKNINLCFYPGAKIGVVVCAILFIRF